LLVEAVAVADLPTQTEGRVVAVVLAVTELRLLAQRLVVERRLKQLGRPLAV